MFFILELTPNGVAGIGVILYSPGYDTYITKCNLSLTQTHYAIYPQNA